MTARGLLLLLPLLLLGCPEPLDELEWVGAPGVTIRSISITQGVERPVMDDGDELDSDVPLIAGRDAMLRAFYNAGTDYDGGEVAARLRLNGQELWWTGTLERASEEDDLDTTINVSIPGDLVEDPLSWSIEVLQERDDDGSNEARWPVEGETETEVEGEINVLRIVIAPFSYEFDGSGRLPDTSPEQVERIRGYFHKLYPVSDVEVTVRDPEPWDNELGSDGSGWTGPGLRLLGMRNADGAGDDVYYYGMFNPTETIQQFCLGGCLLGVTLLNDSPPDTGSVTLRLALGVGFTEEAPGIAAHEIGHAHGRPHTPCGPPGNPPADIDPEYPYPDGNIGIWGYDILEDELWDPDESTDIMGYCDDQWISDYTYRALHDRGQNVNLGWATGPLRTWDLLLVDRDGHASWAASLERRGGIAGHPTDATLLADDGSTASARGVFVRFDHLPGGWLLVPRGDFVPAGAAVQVEGLAEPLLRGR